jgi:hypothetical protein
MAQTHAGAMKAKRKNLRRDPDYYRKLGMRNKGIKKSTPPYLARLAVENPDLHREISAKGGSRPE